MEQQRLVARISRVELTRMLLSLSEIDDLLDLVARTVCETTAFVRSMIMDLDGPSGRVRGRAGHGVPAGSVAGAGGTVDDYPVFAMLAQSGGPLIARSDELIRLMPARCVQLFEVRGVVVAQPMRSDRLGLLGVVFCDGGEGANFDPTAADIQTLQEMSEVAALAFQHALLLRRSAALQSLRERSRIAADLHDGVTQQLYAAILDVDELRSGARLVPEDVFVLERLALRLDTASQQLRSALVQISRGEVPDTAPGGSPGGRVTDRVRALVDDMCRSEGPTADMAIKGDGPEPEPGRADLMVRAVREGLANVAKHARATQVEVQIRRGGSWWTVEVSDDGIGSAVDVRRAIAATDGPTFGLRSLAQDTARLGGRLWVTDAPRLLGIRLGVAVPVAIDN